ncbi:hypothetical protein FHG89_23405 [Micromonospora orduensis]|uniref:Uncharacterized protein n=1 Tax=Micromonospora orduensis TaxID=1420891 RepID=A0A5C4QEN2_9ACTN|nr:hypothetical protein [Micromonospora orduensis]TNH25259.1 hypothetical protein FHG89_23405 [Micromonospora orduensis]
MNPNRPDRRADRAETERLLDAARAAAPAEPPTPEHALPATPEPLARRLAAAAAPARPGELAGEQEALAAFRAARANPQPAVSRRSRRHRLTTGAVAWIGALAATATAGVAFAAVTLDQPPDPSPPAPSSPRPSPTDAGASPSGDRGAEPGRATSGTPSTTGATPSEAVPAGQLHGLCRAWQAKKPDQREKALRTPGFQELVTAAGGAAQVGPYCQELVPEATPTPTATPVPPPTPAKPKSKQSESAKARPSDPPTEHPVRD